MNFSGIVTWMNICTELYMCVFYFYFKLWCTLMKTIIFCQKNQTCLNGRDLETQADTSLSTTYLTSSLFLFLYQFGSSVYMAVFIVNKISSTSIGI